MVVSVSLYYWQTMFEPKSTQKQSANPAITNTRVYKWNFLDLYKINLFIILLDKFYLLHINEFTPPIKIFALIIACFKLKLTIP